MAIMCILIIYNIMQNPLKLHNGTMFKFWKVLFYVCKYAYEQTCINTFMQKRYTYIHRDVHAHSRTDTHAHTPVLACMRSFLAFSPLRLCGTLKWVTNTGKNLKCASSQRVMLLCYVTRVCMCVCVYSPIETLWSSSTCPQSQHSKNISAFMEQHLAVTLHISPLNSDVQMYFCVNVNTVL